MENISSNEVKQDGTLLTSHACA